MCSEIRDEFGIHVGQAVWSRQEKRNGMLNIKPFRTSFAQERKSTLFEQVSGTWHRDEVGLVRISGPYNMCVSQGELLHGVTLADAPVPELSLDTSLYEYLGTPSKRGITRQLLEHWLGRGSGR